MLSRITVICFPLFLAAMSAPAGAATSSPGDIQELVSKCAPGVSPDIMRSLIEHESFRNQFAIGLNKKGSRLPRPPRNKQEAVETAEWLLQNGYNFDSGYGQVNSSNMPGLNLSAEDLFTPCSNVAAAANVFAYCYSKANKHGYSTAQAKTDAALSCYNTGSLTAGLDNGYVEKVKEKAGVLQIPALLQTENPAAQVETRPTAEANTAPPIQEGMPDVFSTVHPGLEGLPDVFSAPTAPEPTATLEAPGPYGPEETGHPVYLTPAAPSPAAHPHSDATPALIGNPDQPGRPVKPDKQ